MDKVKDFKDLHEFMLGNKVHFHNKHGVEIYPHVYKNVWVLEWPADWVLGTLYLAVDSFHFGAHAVAYHTLEDALLGLASIYRSIDDAEEVTVTCVE